MLFFEVLTELLATVSLLIVEVLMESSVKVSLRIVHALTELPVKVLLLTEIVEVLADTIDLIFTSISVS